jgi:hypothetical protein
MKTKEDVEKLEKLLGQLHGAYTEISLLAKKSPNDAINPFKLKLINNVLESANSVLGEGYKPFEDFDWFDPDDVPSASDVTMVFAQYMEEAERFRSDNVIYEHGWKYILNGEASSIGASQPTKVRKK